MTRKKPNILTVVKQTMRDVETLKRDLIRDVKPFWKYDQLSENLQVIASQLASVAEEGLRLANMIDKLENTRDALIVRNKNLRKQVKK